MPCIAGPSRWANHQAQPLAVPLLPRRHYASRKAASGDLDDDRDEQHIRSEWASALVARRSSLRVSKSSRESLPKSVFDVTFSRSSGAGGQHVNKVSTKATVRLCLAAATADGRMYEEEKSPFPLPIPREVARRAAKESPYYAASSQSLLVSSSQSRSQEANLENAVDKLCNHLHSLATAGLVGETSSQQREKVQRLADREKGKMKQLKQKRADVKMGRKKITTWD